MMVKFDIYFPSHQNSNWMFLFYQGPFVLTASLFPFFNRNGTRVINLSSSAHSFAREMDLSNLNSEKHYSSGGWVCHESVFSSFHLFYNILLIIVSCNRRKRMVNQSSKIYSSLKSYRDEQILLVWIG